MSGAKPLKEKEWQKPNVFTPREQEHIFSNTKDDPDLEPAEIAFTIMRNAGVGANELRRTRLKDIDLDSTPPTYHVAGDPTHFDVVPRLIPLNAEAQAAFRRAIERANSLGARYREQFVFPLSLHSAKGAAASQAVRRANAGKRHAGHRVNPIWRHYDSERHRGHPERSLDTGSTWRLMVSGSSLACPGQLTQLKVRAVGDE